MSDLFKIGVTAPGTALNALTTSIPRPTADFQPYETTKTAVSGLVVGAGFPVITWSWGFLTRAQRDQLRTFCTGASSEVYIRTPANDSADTWATYFVRMTWPLNEERYATRRLDFKIKFTMCVLQYTTEP